MSDFAPDVKKSLREGGFREIRRGKGSHAIWGHPEGGSVKLSVPDKIFSRHTANDILKSAGLQKKL
ncbi:MAG: type II toxin-antitoxin system HicA family toxin [Gammaproteobacteria bacterium]|nr:type II toxin-antitoxin system HicA family toxin [Gammaproteobacteria bacterium]